MLFFGAIWTICNQCCKNCIEIYRLDLSELCNYIISIFNQLQPKKNSQIVVLIWLPSTKRTRPHTKETSSVIDYALLFALPRSFRLRPLNSIDTIIMIFTSDDPFEWNTIQWTPCGMYAGTYNATIRCPQFHINIQYLYKVLTHWYQCNLVRIEELMRWEDSHHVDIAMWYCFEH